MSAATSPTRLPVPKVVASTLGAAVAALVLWAIEAVAGVSVPTLVGGAVVTICTFAAGYIKEPGGALYDDAAAARHLDPGRTLCGTIGLVLLVLVAVLTVTTLLGLLVVPWAALIGVGLLGLVLLLLDGSTPP